MFTSMCDQNAIGLLWRAHTIELFTFTSWILFESKAHPLPKSMAHLPSRVDLEEEGDGGDRPLHDPTLWFSINNRLLAGRQFTTNISTKSILWRFESTEIRRFSRPPVGWGGEPLPHSSPPWGLRRLEPPSPTQPQPCLLDPTLPTITAFFHSILFYSFIIFLSVFLSFCRSATISRLYHSNECCTRLRAPCMVSPTSLKRLVVGLQISRLFSFACKIATVDRIILKSPISLECYLYQCKQEAPLPRRAQRVRRA